jgi:hypothetical protein
MLVALINTLGLTELVSDALASRKQKEAESNAKIVDLFKDALDEIKTCRTEQQRVKFYIAVGVQHARVCVVEATDPTPVDQISIVARELERPNLTSGDACRLASFGHRRRRGRCVLDTSG